MRCAAMYYVYEFVSCASAKVVGITQFCVSMRACSENARHLLVFTFIMGSADGKNMPQSLVSVFLTLKKHTLTHTRKHARQTNVHTDIFSHISASKLETWARFAYFARDGKMYSFGLCGEQPSFTLIDNKSTTINRWNYNKYNSWQHCTYTVVTTATAVEPTIKTNLLTCFMPIDFFLRVCVWVCYWSKQPHKPHSHTRSHTRVRWHMHVIANKQRTHKLQTDTVLNPMNCFIICSFYGS